MTTTTPSNTEGGSLLDAFYRDEFAFFLAIPIDKEVETVSFDELVRRKREEGLAVVCWRDSEKASAFIDNVLKGETHLKAVRVLGSDFMKLCERSGVDRNDVLFELL